MSSNNLDNYEYLTGDDLNLKPSTVEKAKFKCFPLGMSLNKVFLKNEVKSVTKNKSHFNYDSKHAFSDFTEGMMNLKKCHH